MRLSPLALLEKLAALVPLPRVHLVRYGGCLAPHSHLWGAIIPTPHQQGVDKPEASTESPCWSWTRLRKRVFEVDMARCPRCLRRSLHIIAAITHNSPSAASPRVPESCISLIADLLLAVCSFETVLSLHSSHGLIAPWRGGQPGAGRRRRGGHGKSGL